MSAVVISKLKSSIALVSDRRSVHNVTAQIGKSNQQLVYYYDGARKIYFLTTPLHSFFAVTAHGSEPKGFDVTQLISQFEQTLPAQRLSIKEYAERLGKFLAGKYPTEISITSQNDSSIFNVVGYDCGIDNPQHYHFELPDNSEPYGNDHKVYVSGDLTHDVFESTKRKVAKSVRKRLGEKVRSKKKLSAYEQKGLTTLSRADGDPLEWMTIEEHIEFAKNLIKDTCESLTQDDAVQTVGRDTDIIVISPRTGVNPIEYGDDDPRLSDLEAATHFISVECCGLRNKFQLDTEKPLREGYRTLPSADDFVCSVCGETLPLSETKAEFDGKKRASR